MALWTRTRGSVHEQWSAAQRRTRDEAAGRRRRAVQALMSGGLLTQAEAYETAVSAAVFAAIERSRPRRRGDR